MKKYELKDRLNDNTSNLVRFRCKDILGDPKDITGVLIYTTIRRKNEHGEIVREMIVGDGITIENDAGGIYVFDKFFLDFGVGRYYLDTLMVWPNTDKKTYSYSFMNVLETGTKNPA